MSNLNPADRWPQGINEASVPANNNARRMDIITGPIISASTAAQPGSPTNGDAYIMPGGHSGLQWGGFATDSIAIAFDSTWTEYVPTEGLRKYIQDVDQNWQFKEGSVGWSIESGGGGTVLAPPALQYEADTGSTADSDPGAGLMKWNNTTQASATVLYLDDDTVDAVTMTSLWAVLISGGLMHLQHATDQDTWQQWRITSVTDASGYVKLGVSLMANGGSFADGDAMLITIAQGSASGSLTNFTEGVNTSTPNATIPVVSLLATNAATNVDIAYLPKGNGAFLLDIPDSASAGGNKRGTNAVDLQIQRSSASQVASSATSTVLGGTNNTASNISAATVGGTGNVASGQESGALSGSGNLPSAQYAATIGGQTNQASGLAAVAMGLTCIANGSASFAAGSASNARSIAHYHVVGSTAGTQRGLLGVGASTTNATPKALSSDFNAAGANNQLTLANNSVKGVRVMVVAFQSSTMDAALFEGVVLIKRGANAAATSIVGSPALTQLFADAGASTWTCAVSANTTNGSLATTVTGEAAKNIRWSASYHDIEAI